MLGQPAESGGEASHITLMTSQVPHPYAIEVHPLETAAGVYRWILRRSGKVLERSDRPHASEEKAWASALKALEVDLSPTGRRI